MKLKIGEKLPTVQHDDGIWTYCCDVPGRLRVVYKNDGKTNMGKDYPAYFYCSNCFTACDGNSNIIGKYAPSIGEVIDPVTEEIIPYKREW